MKSKVSALMDGELDKEDASSVIEAVRNKDDFHEKWKIYHLIGDTLRQSPQLSINITSNVNQKLKNEPTVLSPNTSNIPKPKQQKHKIFAFSVAASVMAMVTAWVITHNSYEPQEMIVAKHPNQDSNLTVVPTMISAPTSVRNYPYPPVEINDYLFVHREFSPGTTMRGQVTNVNTVTEHHERYGR